MLNSNDKIIKHKIGLLNLAEELGNVSKACQVMGYSRDTFYRYKSAGDEDGVQALLERTRRKPNIANRVDKITENAVITSAVEFPAYGQARTSNELRKVGVFVSPSGIRSIWLHHYNTQRTHQGKMCCGRTPIETMIEGKEIWKEKFINQI